MAKGASKTTDRDIEVALRTVARIIERYGDAYWPIFERLENELYARRSRAARLASYRAKPSSMRSLEEGDVRFSAIPRADS